MIELDLSYSMLSGLCYLQRLNLAGNNFQLTPIPSEFGRLENLTHLNLSRSCFSDQTPLEISNLTRLVSLDLSSHPLYRCEPARNVDEGQIKTIGLRSLSLSKKSIGSDLNKQT